MIRGYYTAASGMLYDQKRQENIAQNLSNAETNGFKQMVLVASSQEEATVMNRNQTHEVGSLTMKVGLDEAYLDLSQGQLKATNLTHDFAINGEGYFVLEGADGELLYTRDGSFGVDNQWRLVSKDGYPVVMSNGAYAFVNDEELKLGANGQFQAGNQTYQFMMVQLEDYAQMQPAGANNYRYNGQPMNLTFENTEILQGMVEGSNINVVDEMTHLMSASRSYQANSKVLQAMDQIVGQSVNEIGKI